MLNSKLRGKSVKLKTTTLIGSGEGCHIRAGHPDLKPEHAKLFEDDMGRLLVELLDTDAHLYVNGKDVMRSELRNGDTLRIGPLKFRYIDETLTSSASLRLDSLIEEFENEAAAKIYDFAKEDLFYLVTRNPELRSLICFRIPSRDRFIDQAQAFLSRMANQAGCDEIKHEAFMTCAKELILNAHRHGHEYDETKHILITYRDVGDQLQLVVEDQGTGFDHRALLESVNSVDAATAARDRYKAGGFGGLGFQLISRMADELRYNDAGNIATCTVEKKFD